MKGMIVVSYEQMFVFEGSFFAHRTHHIRYRSWSCEYRLGSSASEWSESSVLGVWLREHERHEPLAARLRKIYEQTTAVVQRFKPSCVGIETVWFGQNITAAFATGQARGAALAACGSEPIEVGEFSPRQIKLAVVGTGSADKAQVQYMVKQVLSLEKPPEPDHAADALAAAICFSTHAFDASGYTERTA